MNDTQISKLKLVINHRRLGIEEVIAFQKAQITGNYHNQATRAYANGRIKGHTIERTFLDIVLDLIVSDYFKKL